MATSAVEIVQRALHKVESDTIESFTEGGTESDLAKLLFDEARQFILKRGLWTWAIKRARLPQVTETPAFGYQYAYRLPADLIKPIEFYADQAGRMVMRDYRREGDGIVCDYTEVYCRYVFDQQDPNKMGPDFRVALEDYLAYQFALSLPGSRALAGDHLERFERVSLPRAMSAEGIEDGEYHIPAGDWLTARNAGSTLVEY